MSEACAVSSCKRSSCALCHCCQKHICLPHLNEHQDLLVSELNPLVDQINTLGDRLKAVNVESKIANARQKLEEWRIESHQKIEHFFKQKCQELDRQITGKIYKQREEISRIQSKIAEFIREQQTTRRNLDLLTSTIDDLKREVDKIEQSSFNIRRESLAINDNMVTIEELGKHKFDLSNLQPVYKTIKNPNSSVPVASNDHVLLMHYEPNLCLVDRTLTIVKQGLWNNARIDDMCWSSVLDRFIVIREGNLFLVDPSKLSIEEISIVPEEKWFSCTCSDRSLYLSTNSFGSSITEYSLPPTIQLIRRWKSPDTCEKDEHINNMRYNNERLALLVAKPHNETVHIELRTSKTLQRLWSLRLNIRNVQNYPFYFCLINEDEWLVADHENSRFIHITSDGKMKEMRAYNSVPWYPCMFGSDILAVATDDSIKFHKF
jgi:hypothetical protein